MRTGLIVAATCLVSSSLAATAVAADTLSDAAGDGATLEEVVVTAEKTSSPLQRTAASIGVVSGEQLSDQNVTQLDDALRNIVGVIVSQGPTGLDPVIRGVGPSVPQNLGGPAGVSSYFDGVYNSSDIASRLGFFDLARIEVLRGPQGTLYGTNAEGGVVSTITNDPTQQFEVSASAAVGNYNLVNVTGALNLPLSSTLALRVAGGSVDRKGYLDNGQDDNRAEGVRAKLLFQPSDSFSALIGYESTHVSGEGPGTVEAFATAPSAAKAYNNACTTVCGPGQYPSDQIDQQSAFKLWADVKADVGIGSLTVIPAYQWLSDQELLQYTGLTQVETSGDGGTIQRSVEVRLASKPNSYVTWQLGYFWNGTGVEPAQGGLATAINGNLIEVATGATPGAVGTGYQTNAHYFGQMTVPLTHALRLVGGLSYSSDQAKSIENGATLGAHTWTNTDWKAGAEFDAAPNSMLYLTASTGFRPGGFSPAPPFSAYGIEKLRSYEFGSKNEFFNHSLRVNGDIFYYDYAGYQVPDLIPCGTAPLPACSNPFAPFNLDILNLPVQEYGAELETEYRLTATDTFELNTAYLHSKEMASVQIAPPFPPSQLQGEPLPDAPKLTFNVSYKHAFALPNEARLEPAVTARYSTSSYVTIPQGANADQAAYWEEDASVAYAPAQSKWRINAYVRNLSDEVVKSNFIGNQLTLQTPRTFGIEVHAQL